MANTAQKLRPKRSVNLLLSEETVRQARVFTKNLSATVDAPLPEYVAHSQPARQSKQQVADAVAEAWQ